MNNRKQQVHPSQNQQQSPNRRVGQQPQFQVQYANDPRRDPYAQVNQSYEKLAEQSPKKVQTLEDDYIQDYMPARYEKSMRYFNQNTYKKKLITGDFKELQLLGENTELKEFGVGIYLHIELFRRVGWMFLLLTLLSAFPIYLNWLGTGLSNYSLSYGTYLIKSTLGNYKKSITNYDAYIMTGLHCGEVLVFFIFYLFWKVHVYTEIQDFEEDRSIVHPSKYCVEIKGLPEHGVNNDELEVFFNNFGPIYECSIVYDYEDNLEYFKEVDQLDEKIKQEEMELRLGDGDKSNLADLKERKQKLAATINSIKINPKILSAYIHFEHQKSKQDMLEYYSNHYMFDSCLHSCFNCMCCCCVETPSNRHLFRAKMPLAIKETKVPDPEEINWESIQISTTGKIFRSLFAFLVILVFIAVCSTLVALCSIFISTNSTNCDGIVIPDYATASTTSNSTIKTCFCNSNLFNFNDAQISSLCYQIFQKLYIQNGLQIAAALISTITNMLFSWTLNSVVEFTKPSSFSSSLIIRALILFLFYLINSAILPLLIYANVFGFKISSYVSLIQLVVPNSSSVFDLSSFVYYSDFTTIWYRNVSPYYTNFLIISFLIIWGKFIFTNFQCSRRVSNLKDEEGKILQKHMNSKIVDYQIDVVEDTAQLMLMIFITFMFSACIPVLIPLAALCILSKYLTMKHLAVAYSRRVSGLTENFIGLATNLIPLALAVGCFFGIWQFTAHSDIYPSGISVEIPGTSSWKSKFELFPRLFYLSYSLIMALVVIVYYFFWNTIVRFFSWLSSLCFEAKTLDNKRRSIPFSHAAKTLNVLSSYNIHSNPAYKNIVISLQRFLYDDE